MIGTGGIGQIAKEAFDTYFAQAADVYRRGSFTTNISSPVPSFPQTLVVTDLPSHYGIELIGARRHARPLRVTTRRVASPSTLFAQFVYPDDTGCCFDMPGVNHSLRRMALLGPDSRGAVDKRFPHLLSAFPTQLEWSGPTRPIIRIHDSTSFLSLENVLLVNSANGSVRAKHVLYLLVVRKDVSVGDYRAFLQNLLKTTDGSEPVAFRLIEQGKAETVLRAGQLANIFLMHGLRETSIGNFLDSHEDILQQALSARRFVTEPHLPWLVESPDPSEKAINPDLFVERSDGEWDVYDLKLPLLARKDLTTGQRRRRRFVQPIEDGIAQLAHYREFLSVAAHRAYASEKYGVVLNRPRYGLIVGNAENFDAKKVADARRRLGRFELVDYDTLLQLYLFANDIVLPGA